MRATNEILFAVWVQLLHLPGVWIDSFLYLLGFINLSSTYGLRISLGEK